MKTTQCLTYENHEDEIASLNHILAQLQQGEPVPALEPTISYILARLDRLMLASRAKLIRYDQRVRP
jgi:hypothetical protein